MLLIKRTAGRKRSKVAFIQVALAVSACHLLCCWSVRTFLELKKEKNSLPSSADLSFFVHLRLARLITAKSDEQPAPWIVALLIFARNAEFQQKRRAKQIGQPAEHNEHLDRQRLAQSGAQLQRVADSASLERPSAKWCWSIIGQRRRRRLHRHWPVLDAHQFGQFDAEVSGKT